MTNRKTKKVTLVPPASTHHEIRKKLKKLETANARTIKRQLPQLADDIREAKVDLPPLIPQDALAGMLFGRESACPAPKPLHGGEEVCVPQLYRVHPEDFGRVIDRFLPRLETDTLARQFVRELNDYLF